jgi:rhodanese-related sulfurtransferase
MKTWILVLLGIGTSCFAASAVPVLQVDNATYAVTVQSGSLVTHTFVVTNVGDETLSIASVRTSCGCTTAALTRRDLAPGESVNVDATVNTAGFTGTVTRTITLHSNDPDHPALVLRIDVTIADVAPTVPAISPSDLKLVFYLLIDVRGSDEYAVAHLFGAVNVPLATIRESPALWASRLPHDVPIVLCGADSEDGRAAGALLLAGGLPNVLYLDGGLAGWDALLGSGTLYAP